jgi:hypothetical protein
VIDVIKTLRWKPVLAGLLCFVCAIPPVYFAVEIPLGAATHYFLEKYLPYTVAGSFMLLITCVLGIAGGYYAIRRRHFKRAMTGGIAALAAISITFYWIGALQDPSHHNIFWQQVFIAVPVAGISLVSITAAVLSGKKCVYIPLTALLLTANFTMDYYFFCAGITDQENNPFITFYPIMLAGLGGLFPVILLALSRKESD